jgi:hypothetical protein
MKPTPTQVALLMSAAGLSLSLPAFASAPGDGSGRPNFALTFGAPARQEQKCVPPAFFVMGSCRILDGKPIGAAIAEDTPARSAALSAQSRQSIDSAWSHSVFKAYSASLEARSDAPFTTAPVGQDIDPAALSQAHRAAAAPTLGKPDDPPPSREALGDAQQSSVDVEREYDADAMAMVLMADPPSRSADMAVGASAPPGKPASGPQRLPASELLPVLAPLAWRHPGWPGIGLPLDGAWHDATAGHGEAGDPHADAPAPSSHLTFKIAESAAVGFAAAARNDEPAASAVEERGVASGGQAKPESDASVLAGALDDGAGTLGPTATERVLLSLAEFVGPEIDSPATVAAEVPAALPQRDDAASMPMALPDALAVAGPSASPKVVNARHACAIERQETADDIVVASHGDRVLMNLAALLSDDGPISGRFAAQTSKTFVASHSEKVLQTLATFRPNQARKAVRAMAASPAGLPQSQDVSATLASDPPQIALTAATVGAGSVEAAKSIDEGHVAPSAPDAASLQAQGASADAGIPTTQEPLRRNPIGNDLVALSTEKLDEVRGGFVNEDGLKISFGIERAVYLNGNLVTTTSLNVADLSKISGGQAQVSSTGTGNLALVQSGQGNTFLPGSISQTAAGIVIQNTLDNQKIQTITRIDAVVNSSSIIRSMNLQSSMRSAVIDSLRR